MIFLYFIFVFSQCQEGACGVRFCTHITVVLWYLDSSCLLLLFLYIYIYIYKGKKPLRRHPWILKAELKQITWYIVYVWLYNSSCVWLLHTVANNLGSTGNKRVPFPIIIRGYFKNWNWKLFKICTSWMSYSLSSNVCFLLGTFKSTVVEYEKGQYRR